MLLFLALHQRDQRICLPISVCCLVRICRLRCESLSGRLHHALGVRASIAGGKQHGPPLSHRSQQQTHRSYSTQASTTGACNSNPSFGGQTHRSSGADAGRCGTAAGHPHRASAVGNPYRDAAGSFVGLGSGAGGGVGPTHMRQVVGEQPEWDLLVKTARSTAGGMQSVSRLC